MTPERVAAEEAEAQEYAAAIRRIDGQSDVWGMWNRYIIAKWSKTALLRIKTRAWQIVERER